VAVCLHARRRELLRTAFLAQGIEVEDPCGPHMLCAIDRFKFLAVAAAAPGLRLVALHSGAADGSCRVLSYLTRRLGFDSDSTVAWIAMAHPALLAAPEPAQEPGTAVIDGGG
jgi:hypothetical protein